MLRTWTNEMYIYTDQQAYNSSGQIIYMSWYNMA